MFFKAKFAVNTWLRIHEIAFYVKIFPSEHVPAPYLNITKNKGILLTTTKNVLGIMLFPQFIFLYAFGLNYTVFAQKCMKPYWMLY